MKKIAVVAAQGFGDALILQIASCQLQGQGFSVTTFSNHLKTFGNWFEGFAFADQPDESRLLETFSSFDAIFLQHDNSKKAKEICKLPLPIYRFYGSHSVKKHGFLKEGFDFVCDPDRTMADNVAKSLEKLFGFAAGKENGLQPPEGWVHRLYKTRVVIHPSSSAFHRNWPLSKFEKLAKQLRKMGFEPVFSPQFPSLGDLASFIYESGFFIGNDSGPGHLASCLGIPHLIIAEDERYMRLWRPGWLPGTVATLPHWLPRWIRKHWKILIPTNNIIKKLKNSVLNN